MEQPRDKSLARQLIAAAPWLLLGTLPLWVSVAQGAHEVEEPDPAIANPGSEATESRPRVPGYQSPIGNFKGFEDVDSPDWRAANDRVGEIGGWRVYAREPFEPSEPEMEAKPESEPNEEGNSDTGADRTDPQ